MAPAQWREVVKGKVYALYVHEHYRVAIAQTLEKEGWVVTLPDDPQTKHPAKSQDDAFKLGRKISKAWMQHALKQLSLDDTSGPKELTPAEVQADLKARQRPFKA